jgi:tetratricopeptide (TPR) repeat protein
MNRVMNPRRPRSLLLVVEGLDEETASGLPVLRERINGGSLSELAAPLPGSRPAAFGTVMTGVWPDQHGLLLPVMPSPDGSSRRAVEAADRTRPAIWELLGLHGVPCVAVGWPAAEGGSSDGIPSTVIGSGFGGTTSLPRSEALERFVSPSKKAPLVADCWMTADELDLAALTELAPEWGQVEQAKDPRLAILAEIVARNVSRHAAFLELLAQEEWEFATLLLQLPADLARLEATSAERGDAFFTGLGKRGALLLDAFLGAILSQLPQDVRILIAGVPDAEAAGRQDGGFVLLHGPGITPGAKASGASLLDLAPTVWRLHGHAAPDCVGRPLVEVMQDYPLIRNFSIPWKRPSLLSTTRASEADADAAWLTRWQILAIQLRARSLMARGEWLSAMPLLEKQLLLQPDSVALLALLVECQYFAGLYREALANAWDVMDLADPEDPVPVLMVAGLEAINGQLPKARMFLDQAAPLVVKHPAARLFQGRVLIHLRQWQEAKAVLTELLVDEPRNAVALGQLARAHLGLRDWTAACEAALKATALNLHDATVHEILGTALLKTGLTAEAWAAFRAATDITPSWPRPWARLAHLARQMGKGEAEIERLTARYRAAVKISREKTRAYLDSVKAGLAAHEEAIAATVPAESLATGSSRPAAVSAQSIIGMVAMTGSDPAFLREVAEALGLEAATGAQSDPADAFWQPLLDAPVGRVDLFLEEGKLYLMPASVPARLPKQHTYRLVMVNRPPEEILNGREHLPRSVVRLAHEDLLDLLLKERSAMDHLAEFSLNLSLFELQPGDFKKGSGDSLSQLKEFLRISEVSA